MTLKHRNQGFETSKVSESELIVPAAISTSDTDDEEAQDKPPGKFEVYETYLRVALSCLQPLHTTLALLQARGGTVPRATTQPRNSVSLANGLGDWLRGVAR